jgi:transposase
MLVLEAKFTEKSWQYELLEAAIHPANFIRNKFARYRMDHHGVSKNDRQKLYALLAKELERAGKLNSQARQASTDRAWAALSRFYTNCKEKEPVKKGYQLENLNFLKQSEKSLKRLQGRVSKNKKGFKNRKIAIDKMARKHSCWLVLRNQHGLRSIAEPRIPPRPVVGVSIA